MNNSKLTLYSASPSKLTVSFRQQPKTCDIYFATMHHTHTRSTSLRSVTTSLNLIRRPSSHRPFLLPKAIVFLLSHQHQSSTIMLVPPTPVRPSHGPVLSMVAIVVVQIVCILLGFWNVSLNAAAAEASRMEYLALTNQTV